MKLSDTELIIKAIFQDKALMIDAMGEAIYYFMPRFDEPCVRCPVKNVRCASQSDSECQEKVIAHFIKMAKRKRK